MQIALHRTAMAVVPLLLVLCISHAVADVIEVQTEGDAFSAVNCTLRTAITAFNTGVMAGACASHLTVSPGIDTITFHDGVNTIVITSSTNEDLNVNGDYDTLVPLLINGPVTIEGGMFSSHFHAFAELHLIDVTLNNGREFCGIDKGASVTTSSTLVLTRCTFSNNVHTGSACSGVQSSAVLVVNSVQNVQVEQCTFSGNGDVSPEDKLGAFAVVGGTPLVTMQDVVFTDNIATLGGGVYLDSLGTTTTTLANANFQNNRAQFGGGVYLGPNLAGTSTTLIEATFVSNEAFTYGGAIYASQSTVIDGTSVMTNGNLATSGGFLYMDTGALANLNTIQLSSNTATMDGGAILASGANTVLISSDVSNSGQNAGQYGGMVFMGDNGILAISGMGEFASNSAAVGGIIYADQSAVELYASALMANTATSAGGACFFHNTLSSYINVQYLTDNSAVHGGVLYALDSNEVVLTSTSTSNNDATLYGGVACALSTTVRLNLGVMQYSDATNGGVVYSSNSSLYLEGTVASHNAATGFGGVAYLANGNFAEFSCPLIFNNSGLNGGVIASTLTSEIVLKGDQLYANTASAGGAVFALGNPVATNTITFKDFLLIEEHQATVGGVAYVTNSDVTFENITGSVSRNRATTSGGVISLTGTIHNNFYFTGSGVNMDDNTAGVHGGVIFALSCSNLTINGLSYLTNNQASSNGGAVYATNYVISSDLSIFADYIGHNYSTNLGGVVYAYGQFNSVELLGNGLYSNTAENGGVVYHYGQNYIPQVDVDMGYVRYNESYGGGGGVIYSVMAQSVSLRAAADITGNRCAEYINAKRGLYDCAGGVIFASQSNIVAVQANNVTSNTAEGPGGVLYIDDVSESVYIEALQIDLNTAHSGGVIHARSYFGRIDEVAVKADSIMNNQAIGGGGVVAVYAINTSAPTNVLVIPYIGNAGILDHNTCGASGGVAYVYGNAGIAISSMSSISNNVATTGSVVHLVDANDAYIAGSGPSSIWDNTQGISMVNSNVATFTNFESVYGGGVAGGIVYCNQCTSVNISNCMHLSSSVTLGGVIYTYNATATVTLSESIFDGCTATTGGVVYMIGGTLVDSGTSEFRNNHANENGGVFYTSGTTVVIGTSVNKSLFITNGADAFGGVLYQSGGPSSIFYAAMAAFNNALHGAVIYSKTTADLYVYIDNLRENIASGCGGAVYSTSVTYITSSLVKYNSAGDEGGVIYCSNSVHLLARDSLSNNSAYHGGVVSTGSNVVSGVFVTSLGGLAEQNTATDNGGIVYTFGFNVEITGFAGINENSATNGGVVSHPFNISYTGITIESNDVKNNRASSFGGVVYSSHQDVEVIGTNELTGNMASLGGVIYATDASQVRVSGFYSVSSQSSAYPLIYAGHCDYVIVTNVFQTDAFLIDAEYCTNVSLSHIGTATSSGLGHVLYTDSCENINLMDIGLIDYCSSPGSGGFAYVKCDSYCSVTMEEMGSITNNYANVGSFLYAYASNGIDLNVEGGMGSIMSYNGNTPIYVFNPFNGDCNVNVNGFSSIDNNYVSRSNQAAVITTIRCTTTLSDIGTIASNNGAGTGCIANSLEGSLDVSGVASIVDNFEASSQMCSGHFYGESGVSLYSIGQISNNSAYTGGVVYCSGAISSLTSIGSITSNYAEYGGVVFSDSCDVTIMEATVISNNQGFRGGGVVYAINSDVMITSAATLTSNTAANGSGGVVFAYSATNIEVNANSMEYNLALNGGVLYATSTISAAAVQVKGQFIRYNTATDEGGVMHVTGDGYGSSYLIGNTPMGSYLDSNTAQYGAVSVHNGHAVIQDFDSVSHNLASQEGGVVFSLNLPNTSTRFQKICRMINNEGGGGAILFSSAIADLEFLSLGY